MSDRFDPTKRDRAASCPVCGAPQAAPYAPFCSKRCADVDLHRWLADGYVIPGKPAEDDDL
ncbi:MAG: DNA gyrase inhibitor YacG [Pseudomonadota bacterium]